MIQRYGRHVGWESACERVWVDKNLIFATWSHTRGGDRRPDVRRCGRPEAARRREDGGIGPAVEDHRVQDTINDDIEAVDVVRETDV